MAGKKTKITHWVNNKNSLINWRALGNCEVYEKIIFHRCLKSLNLGIIYLYCYSCLFVPMFVILFFFLKDIFVFFIVGHLCYC